MAPDSCIPQVTNKLRCKVEGACYREMTRR